MHFRALPSILVAEIVIKSWIIRGKRVYFSISNCLLYKCSYADESVHFILSLFLPCNNKLGKDKAKNNLLSMSIYKEISTHVTNLSQISNNSNLALRKHWISCLTSNIGFVTFPRLNHRSSIWKRSWIWLIAISSNISQINCAFKWRFLM